MGPPLLHVAATSTLAPLAAVCSNVNLAILKEIVSLIKLYVCRQWGRAGSETGNGNENTLHTTSAQSLFQIHIQRISLSQEAILSTGNISQTKTHDSTLPFLLFHLIFGN
jgi:hypothetical protein